MPRNEQLALGWYLRAAEQGHAGAQDNLGMRYEHGQGVERDPAQALHWYRQAADQGLPSAQYHLGQLYDSGNGIAQHL